MSSKPTESANKGTDEIRRSWCNKRFLAVKRGVILPDCPSSAIAAQYRNDSYANRELASSFSVNGSKEASKHGFNTL
jgi:hypothetical protein